MGERKPIDVDTARSRMASLCARSEMCEFEIRTKLYRLGLSEEDTESVIDYLVEHRFVDDARYARAFAGDKSRFAGWGRQKIRMALMQKRIGSAEIAEALESIPHTAYATSLIRAARARAAGLDLDDRADVAKLYRRLLSRGFESALVVSAIDRIRRERREEE